MFPLRPVARLDMVTKRCPLAVVDCVEPDKDEHESCEGEAAEERVLSGQGAKVVGGGMMQMHYVS